MDPLGWELVSSGQRLTSPPGDPAAFWFRRWRKLAFGRNSPENHQWVFVFEGFMKRFPRRREVQKESDWLEASFLRRVERRVTTALLLTRTC